MPAGGEGAEGHGHTAGLLNAGWWPEGERIFSPTSEFADLSGTQIREADLYVYVDVYLYI